MHWHTARARLHQIADTAFPELQGMPADLRELGVLRRFAPLVTSPFSRRIYAVRDFVEGLPDPAVEGLLAHELMHLVQFAPLTLPQKVARALCYVFSRRYRAALERAADVGALEHGFARELLAAKEYGRAHYPQMANYGEFYLTEDEIRAWMQKHGLAS